MKVCTKCLIKKEVSEYYKGGQYADGYFNICKECLKKLVKERYKKRVSTEKGAEEYRRKKLEYYHNGSQPKETNRTPVRDVMKKFYDKYPEKYAAKIACNYIHREPGTDLHHWSYLPEFQKDIIRLTEEEHRTAHRFIIYDQERQMYRSLSGELLDTKEKHLSHIQQFFI